MKSSRQASAAFELVPLADRLRYMRVIRLSLVVVIAALAAVNPGDVAPGSDRLWWATAAYVGLFSVGEATWRMWRRRGLWLFGALLVADAAYLVCASYLTGGMSSPLRYMVLLHVIGVALLASYRTGLKLVVWYVLLLLVEHYLPPAARAAGGDAARSTSYVQLAIFCALVACVAFGTSTLSAVNERELRRRRFDLEALATLASELEHATDVRTVASTAVDSINDNFGIERLAIVQLAGPPQLLAGRGIALTAAPEPEPGPDSVATQAVHLRATLLPTALSPIDDAWLYALFGDVRNVVVTPLFAEGGCTGVLVFEHGSRHGSRIERRLLTIIERFASHTALALRNAMLLETVQRAAATDPLTGLANRRSFEAALEREVARSSRSGEPVTLVMLDIDHFKRLNDTYGHQMGDTVLQNFAAALLEHCREMDVAARYGGEEFAVILPSCGPDEAATSAVRLWDVLAESNGGIPLTVSAGYATYPDHADTGDALVTAADRALYEAKRKGRNQVVGCTAFEPRNRLGLVTEGT